MSGKTTYETGFICKSAFQLFIFLVVITFNLQAQNSVTFALLTDLHVSPGSPSDSSLHLIVSEINQIKLDFVIVAGDISNVGSDAEMLAVRKSLGKLNKPCYVLPGNHETNWSESAGLEFNTLWGNDRFIFSKNEYLFVGFNTGPYMKMGDGLVKQEDIQWLKHQLELRKSDNEVLIAVTHYPLAEGMDNWLQVTELLKSYNCRLAFCGHGHRLGLYNFNGIPGIMGRSALAGPSSGAGYNIVTLRNDSVIVTNKEIKKPLTGPLISLNYIRKDALTGLPVSQAPDYSINQAWKGIETVFTSSDTASIFTGPCLTDDSVLIYGNSLGWIKAFGTGSRKILWQTRVSAPVYSTPVSSDGVVMLGTVDNKIIGLDSHTGKYLWEVRAGRPAVAEGTVENGSLYIGGGDKDFFKINVATGKIQWHFTGTGGLIQGKPAVSNTSVVFGAWDTYLYCIDKNSGNLKWKWTNGKPQKLYSPANIHPVCSNERVFIVAPDRYMTSLDINSGKEIWRTNRYQVRESMGVSPDGTTIYAKLMNDTVIAVSAKEGYPKIVWASDAGFGYEHNPCPVFATGHEVIAATRNGMLVAIDPINGSVIWKYKAGYSSVNKIIEDKNKIFWFTLAEGKLVGIRKI